MRLQSPGARQEWRAPQDHPRTTGGELHVFFLLSYCAALAFCLPFFSAGRETPALTRLYGIALLLTYPLIYLLPAILSTGMLLAALRRRRGRWKIPLVRGVAILTTAGTLLLLFVDGKIHDIYGFHFNGFVLNLVVTPGGIESMGAGSSTYHAFALFAAGVVVLQASSFWVASRIHQRHGRLSRFIRHRAWIFALLALSVAERIGYGVAHVQAHSPTLAAAETFPFYSRLTFDRLARKWGFEVRRVPRVGLDLDSGQLEYPRGWVQSSRPEHPLNLVWLVAESWRADALDQEIMPATWAFAGRALRFTEHYSGGNGTRMGVFSMFYGLYGTYWFPMLAERRGPVLIDSLVQQGYQLSINTSAKFSYPEFDRTVFVDVSPEDLHQWNEGQSWERDREEVDGVLAFLDSRDRSRPFMVFSFFESPHARYMFPEESVVASPYLEDFNYATMSLERDIELIRNRYLNACHHLDGQLARILDYLGGQGLLEETLVVVTGDHGEEFLEKGHWGHGSSFCQEQIRVPLVLWIPGHAAASVERMTSHLDLCATILHAIGVANPEEDLSLGHDLLGPCVREHSVVVDWSRLCIVTDEVKEIFPFKVAGAFRTETTDRDDRPVRASGTEHVPVDDLAEVLSGMSRFKRTAARR